MNFRIKGIGECMEKLCKKRYRFNQKGLFLLIFFSAVLIYWLSVPLYATEKIPIYLYSPETNINNFKSLKMEFDTFLSKNGEYEFQPFGSQDVFEKNVKGNGKCVLLLSSWYFCKIRKEFSLKPVLVGIRKGKKYQKRILVSSEKNADLKIAAKGPVASASNEPYTRSILKLIFQEGNTSDSVRILTVPKDVDSLMSVGFDMAKAALASETALEKLKNLDTSLYSRLKILAEGNESLLMIVAVPENFEKEAEKPIQLFQEMSNLPDGMNIIKMLDLDSWQLIDSSDLQHLEG